MSWDDDHFLDLDGVRIHYKDAGGRGEPVLFIHGYTASIGGQWGRPGLIAGIRERGWRTIAFDLRGHGMSDRPHDGAAYAGERMARDIEALLDHLDIQRAHLVGYSLGAHILVHGLTLFPERAATVCLGGAAGRWNWTEAETLAVMDEADELETGSIGKHILRLWPPGKPRPTDEELRALSDRKLEGMDARALAAIKRAMPDHQVSVQQMQALKMPILAVVGTGDGQLEAMRQLAGFHPGVTLVEVPGAGHGDCPGKPEYLDALSAFLTQHAGTSADVPR
ncbi:Pimeloyl-ACP methyl ester carboxylesterase [Devosia lucknowensis]|uniref:Pimeloyl-ACP methyl ester carboxylesterase n=1 Tax=Devosia lucknowensis TaxID=1096929 RepID=A0A1Y6G6J3_9HYPH|nr:alpha/beta hydrolase [Devosia lucknowensis]SMQ85765.1 Pimeloyl-ACP methyl ester carboxylesterase [Devosia lucknowensis]